MALKSIIAKLEDVDESLREHYTEKDGTFYLNIEDFGKHPGAVTLKTTANKLDTDKKKLEADLKALNDKFGELAEDEGFSVEEYNRLKAGNKDTPEAIKTLQEQHAAAIKKLTDKHAADIAAANGTVTELNGYIDNSLIDSGLKDSLLDIGVNPDLMDGAVASIRSKVKVTKDDKGNRVATVTTDIGEVPLVDYVKEWSGDKGKPYLGKPAGPGAEGNGRRQSTKTKGDFGGNRNDRADAIRSKFPDLA